MGKGKGKPNSSVSSSSRRDTIRVDPVSVYFTHARVRPIFTGCNKMIEETLQEIINRVTKIDDIPMITVLESDGCLFSLNNRRLYLFKELAKRGLLPPEGVLCQTKPMLVREKDRYTPQRCSLQARLMGVRPAGDKIAGGDEEAGDCLEEEEITKTKET